jgi:CheY-like chemotaxis protein
VSRHAELDAMFLAPRRPLVLVVDDFVDGRELLGDLLRLEGFAIAMAADGLEAVARAVEVVPDAILMDIGLPRLDGIAATRRIKAHPATAAIPVIALTAYVVAEVHDRARDAGCVQTLLKPYEQATIIESLIRALRRSPSPRRARDSLALRMDRASDPYGAESAEDFADTFPSAP